MLFFYLKLTSKQQQELLNALAKARIRGDLALVNRITTVRAVADSGFSLENIANSLYGQ